VGGEGQQAAARSQRRKTMKPSPNSHDYRTVTPYLKLPNCERLIEFLKNAFGATETSKLSKPDGSVLHAEIYIGNTLLMVHEQPGHWTPKPCTLYLRVEDTDAAYKQAIAAGAVSIFEPTNMYYGARVACVTDVAGNDWWIATHVENISLEETQQRATAFLEARAKDTQSAQGQTAVAK
jgi:PhnB protein